MIMKLTRKVLAMVLALTMILGLALSVSADETKYTLTINNTDAGHTYEAYQIFDGTLSTDGTTLSNITWGSSVKDGTGLLEALLTDKKEIKLTNGTTTLEAVFASAAALTDPADQLVKLAELLGNVSNDSSTLDRFAEVVGQAEYDADGKFVKHTYLGDPVATDDYTDFKYELNVPAGYYLVKDKEGTQEGEDDYYTKYIVRVVQSAAVNPKGSGITVEKTINDTLDGTYDDVEDFDINDDVYYKWVGTLPTNLRAYDEYWYKFTDTLPAGITFVQFEQVYIESHNGTTSHTFYDVTDTDTTNDELPKGITPTTPKEGEGGGIVTLTFDDLLTLYPSLLSTDKVVVKYRCYLNRDAVISKPNTNEVYLEYDNNPNGEGHGKTVKDVAHAFTFSFTVDKYDMADSTKKLEGVEFKLYYRTVDANENIVKMYAVVVTEEMIEDKKEVNGKVVDNDDLGMIYDWTADADEASILDTDAKGEFYVKGLDEGTYFLEEIKTVDGYNLLDTPIQIDIIPTYDEQGNECSVTVEYKVDAMTQGNRDVVGVRNSKGSTLPSTGGIGTTLFYVFGGILFAGAAILLITKKRMAV